MYNTRICVFDFFFSFPSTFIKTVRNRGTGVPRLVCRLNFVDHQVEGEGRGVSMYVCMYINWMDVRKKKKRKKKEKGCEKCTLEFFSISFPRCRVCTCTYVKFKVLYVCLQLYCTLYSNRYIYIHVEPPLFVRR